MARIDDGFSTQISFSLSATVKFYEKTVTPPGLDSGGANEITTMRNTVWRTKAPKKLITLADMTFVAAYDPEVYTDILTMLGKNQTITVHFPDASTLAIAGWIDKFIPGELADGTQPTANVTIIPSNLDPTAGTEKAPVYTAPPP